MEEQKTYIGNSIVARMEPGIWYLIPANYFASPWQMRTYFYRFIEIFINNVRRLEALHESVYDISSVCVLMNTGR